MKMYMSVAEAVADNLDHLSAELNNSVTCNIAGEEKVVSIRVKDVFEPNNPSLDPAKQAQD